MDEINVRHTKSTFENLQLDKLADLGEGRAAQVSLVRDIRSGNQYAEKTFKSEQGLSPLFRNFLYRLCFQAPFPYRSKESAIKACLFRRKVLRDLTEFWFGRPLVADAYYTRWDENAEAYVLGTEYIKGCGPKPGPVNPHKIRHFFHNYPVRLYRKITRSEFQKATTPPWEIEEAIQQLDALKNKFHQAGFIGSEWQVNKTLSVPTSNLLKDSKGQWILIDVESAFPAIIFPRDIWRAIRFGSVPLFDDIDFTKLHRYLSNNTEAIEACLGKDRYKNLNSNITQLQYHTSEWKEGELAVFSHRHRLLTDATLREKIRDSLVDHWLITGRVSADKAQHLRKSILRLYGYLLIDLFKSIRTTPIILAHGLKAFGVGIGRVFRSFADVIYSAFFSEQRLQQMAEIYTNERIDRWEKSERLSREEADRLRQDLESPSTVEYLKGLVVQIGLSALTPPVVSDVIIVSLAFYADSHKTLLALFFTAFLRTIYTLYRMIRNRTEEFSYRYALLIGAVPHIGILAYPAQMSFAHPDLSQFLSRCQASSLGAHFPLFGGTDSRLEHFCMRSTDWAVSLLHEVRNLMKLVRSGFRRGRNGAPTSDTHNTDLTVEEELRQD